MSFTCASSSDPTHGRGERKGGCGGLFQPGKHKHKKRRRMRKRGDGGVWRKKK